MLDLHEHVSAEHLSDYLRGALGGDDETNVEAHVGTCLVCTRRLREEAQLEVLLHEAVSGDDVVVLPVGARPMVGAARRGSRRGMWQRITAVVANSAAAAAALLLVIAPGQQLTPHTAAYVTTQDGTSAPASVSFINDAFCTPATDDLAANEECFDSVTLAMTTDPDDYLSPFDREWATGWSADRAGRMACLVEDLACEPG